MHVKFTQKFKKTKNGVCKTTGFGQGVFTPNMSLRWRDYNLIGLLMALTLDTTFNSRYYFSLHFADIVCLKIFSDYIKFPGVYGRFEWVLR